MIDNCCSASCGIKRLRLRASDGTMDSMDTMDDSSCCPRRPWPADDQIGKRHPLVIGRFLLPLQWKPFFVSAMSHPYRVQFFLGGVLTWGVAPLGACPRLVCGTLSACNFVVCGRNLANGTKRASSGRVEAASSRFRVRLARLPAACTQSRLFSESAATNG